MKEKLSIENREALAAYRYQRAQETLAEVPFLRQQGYYNTFLSRTTTAVSAIRLIFAT